jgi:hypothetical protein
MDYANLIAAIQGIIAAIGVWQTERNYKKTQETYRDTVAATLRAPDIRVRAETLRQILPPNIAQTFRDNLDACMERFNGCIKGKSTDEEFVSCEEANQKCICSNLRALLRSNGSLPPDLYPLWMTFGCGPKPPLSLTDAFADPTAASTNEVGQVSARQFQKLNS